MTSVLVRANKVVKTIARERPLRATESANGGARYEVNAGVTIYIGGTVVLTNGKVSSISNPNPVSTAEQRRQEVKQWLLTQEREPISNWRWGEANARKSQNTWEWLEMIGKASALDANLTDATRWGWIEAEMAWTTRKWYTEHNVTQWNDQIDNLLNRFYSTASNGNVGSARTTMAMTANDSQYGSLAKYLES